MQAHSADRICGPVWLYGRYFNTGDLKSQTVLWVGTPVLKKMIKMQMNWTGISKIYLVPIFQRINCGFLLCGVGRKNRSFSCPVIIWNIVHVLTPRMFCKHGSFASIDQESVMSERSFALCLQAPGSGKCVHWVQERWRLQAQPSGHDICTCGNRV